MALPLKSRHANDIMDVTSLMYGRLRSLGLPLHRVHTDRAREFTSKQFSCWLRQRDVVHTTTGGDEHQGCARAEGEINVLKNRTRLLMDTATVASCEGQGRMATSYAAGHDLWTHTT